MEHVAIEVDAGLAEVRLRRPKVNAMNSVLLKDLRDAFEQVENDSAVQGALLTGDGSCLSAGLDLKEVASLDRAGTSHFLELMDQAFDAAFRFSKPLAVAVEGHAIAGGLVIAMCADYIAFGAGDYKVGLTELAVGVPFPPTAWEIVRLGVPARALRKLVNEAETHSPKAIFEMGIGDVLVDDPRLAARNWLSLVTSRPLETFRLVKSIQRKEAWERIDAHTVVDRTRLLDTLMSTRQPLEK